MALALPYPLRIVRSHVRLFSAATCGVLAMIALPASWHLTTRLTVAWDLGAALYLCLIYALMAREGSADIRRRADRDDEGRFGILVLTVAAAIASLGVIAGELSATAKPGSLDLAMLGGTILLSWAVIHTVFAMHYAHVFYDEDSGGAGGLAFPGGEPPDYWDFLYVSVVIGMTSQVSDVVVTGRAVRRTVLAHSIVAFCFNTALLAFAVNIAASAISGR